MLQMISCEFGKIFKKTNFVEHLRTAASASKNLRGEGLTNSKLSSKLNPNAVDNI